MEKNLTIDDICKALDKARKDKGTSKLDEFLSGNIKYHMGRIKETYDNISEEYKALNERRYCDIESQLWRLSYYSDIMIREVNQVSALSIALQKLRKEGAFENDQD